MICRRLLAGSNLAPTRYERTPSNNRQDSLQTRSAPATEVTMVPPQSPSHWRKGQTVSQRATAAAALRPSQPYECLRQCACTEHFGCTFAPFAQRTRLSRDADGAVGSKAPPAARLRTVDGDFYYESRVDDSDSGASPSWRAQLGIVCTTNVLPLSKGATDSFLWKTAATLCGDRSPSITPAATARTAHGIDSSSTALSPSALCSDKDDQHGAAAFSQAPMPEQLIVFALGA